MIGLVVEGGERMFERERMLPTARADVRHCNGCKKDVHYCATIEDARRHALSGRCVAVDSVLVRAPGDLEPRAVMAGAMPMPPPSSRR